MSEAARKAYFFVPPSSATTWSAQPPATAGFYWVLAAQGPRRASEPELVHFDPARGVTPATRRLLDDGVAATAIPLERIALWWPVPLVPPPVL